MSRKQFWDLFTLNPDGSISPNQPIKIAGVVLEPNRKYTKGMLFSGFDFFQFYGRDLELQEQLDNEPPVVTGAY